jgi:S1-C subfamily serine protease
MISFASRLLVAVAALALSLYLSGCDFTRSVFLFSGEPEKSVLRVHSTIQYPDFKRPWLKKQPFTRDGLGTIISGRRILVTADMAAHTTCIDLETTDKKVHATATVESVDEECNLAILRPSGEEILKETKELTLDGPLPVGTTLRILQLEGNGSPAMSTASITTAALGSYPSGNSYLMYRSTTTIPQRDGSFEIPALHDGKLAGLVMRYDSRTQSADIIPSPLIERFLREASKPGFKGLARAGIIWAPLRGATLREWFGLSKDQGGVAIAPDRKGPAEKAGLKKGDVILSLGGKPIDAEGNYEDPVFGKTCFGNLVSLDLAPGDHLDVVYFRPDGKGHGSTNNASLLLEGRTPETEISPSILLGDSVPYTFFGGLLFQELSRSYLREWGNNWPSEAPQNLVALDVFQNEETGDRKRYVILSGFLPSEQTLGAERLTNHPVEKINGMPINSLSDVAEARKHPAAGFHRIDLEGGAGSIFLEADTLDSEEARLKSQYGIPAENGAPIREATPQP